MSFIFNAGSDTLSFLFCTSFSLSVFFLEALFFLSFFYLQCAPCKVGKNLINQVLKHIAQGRKKNYPLLLRRNHQVPKVL